MSIDWFDIKGNSEQEYKGWTLNRGKIAQGSSRTNRLSIKGPEDLGAGLIGRHDTPFKSSTIPLELFTDSMADYNGTLGFHGIRADNIITYITPSVGGFQFAAATIPGAGGTRDGDISRKANSLTNGYSFAATYGNGPWYASAAYLRGAEVLRC